jgi:hypothetical protein
MNEIDDTNKTYHMDEIDAQRNHTIPYMDEIAHGGR